MHIIGILMHFNNIATTEVIIILRVMLYAFLFNADYYDDNRKTLQSQDVLIIILTEIWFTRILQLRFLHLILFLMSFSLHAYINLFPTLSNFHVVSVDSVFLNIIA